jgi:cathepsin L
MTTLVLGATSAVAQPRPAVQQTAIPKTERPALRPITGTAGSPEIQRQLDLLRQQIAQKHLSFVVDNTSAMSHPLSQLAGLRVPANLAQLAQAANAEAQRILGTTAPLPPSPPQVKLPPGVPQPSTQAAPFMGFDKLRIPGNPLANCIATQAAFDYRKMGKVTSVKDQGNCGSCWAFATAATFESSYLMRNGRAVDVSEEELLRCSGSGTCQGGWWAFDQITHRGLTDEATYPYDGKDLGCREDYPQPYRGFAWGYVDPFGGQPTVAQLKLALCMFGPLAVSIDATPCFQAYHGGVFDENMNDHTTNHAITLIGWDDAKGAWIIKNSWSENWGETCGYGTSGGYGWVKYGANNVGSGAAFIVSGMAQSNSISGSFDANIRGFHIQLESGTASYTPNTVALTGTVSVWHQSNPGRKVRFRNATGTVTRGTGVAERFDLNGKVEVVDGGATLSLGHGDLTATTTDKAVGHADLEFGSARVNAAVMFGPAGYSGEGSLSGGDAGWFDLPRFTGWEAHVQDPKLSATVATTLVTAKLCATKIEARTKDKNKVTNDYWAKGEVSQPCIGVRYDLNPKLDLSLPHFSALPDVNKSARDHCKDGCSLSPPNLRGDCKNACDGAFPSPPSLPALPTSIEVDIKVTIK